MAVLSEIESSRRASMVVKLKSKKEIAVGLAKLGFRVFPLQPDSKLPVTGLSWAKTATAEAAEIERLWTPADDGVWRLGDSEYREEPNIGIATGDGLAVLDVDNKGKKRGSDTLAFLEMVNDGLPPTLIAETPTGGLHYFFQVTEDLANSAGKLGEGLDIRGRGGFVVAAGSTIGGKAYRWQTHNGEAQLAPAYRPDWLFGMANKARAKKENTAEVAGGIELDDPSAVARATQYLKADAPTAVEGAAGDETTYRVAARVKDFGISMETCLDLMLDEWNDRCAPPWPPSDLETKVKNAYRYGERQIGADSAKAEFGEVAAEDGAVDWAEPESDRPRLYRKKFKDAKPDLERIALIEDYLDQGAMSVLYGESNSGKTFVALDLAFHVATGRPWYGKAVHQGPAIYVAAEGGRMIENRFEALRRHFKVDDVPLDLVPCPVDLLRPKADTKPLIALIEEAQKEYGRGPALVTIDTLSRALAGGNENAPDDMGALVKNLDRIRAATGAHLMIIHHTGKDKANGARGHSLLRAATDTEIEIDSYKILTRKQRDMEQARPVGFELVSVSLGQGARGKEITSCVVGQIGGAAADFSRLPMTGEEREVYTALEMLSAGTGAEWVAGKDWTASYRELKGVPSLSSSARSILNRARESLLAKSWVKRDARGCFALSDMDKNEPESVAT